jgi:hypothetical protein
MRNRPVCSTALLLSSFALPSCVDVADPARDPSGGVVSAASVGEDADGDDDDDSGGSIRLDLGADADLPATCAQDVDIVFVMDVTGSMGEFIGSLVDDLHTVDAAVQALELPSPPRYGLVVFADDWAVLNDGQPYADLASLEAEFATWISFTQQDGQVGGDGELNESFPENSLDALVAATAFAWRPAETTTRVVIHTTDDTFWDGPGVFNGETVEHGYDDTVASLQAESIRVFAFAAERGGDCECVDTSPGWFAPYEGNASIPESTDGGVFHIRDVLEGSLSLGAAIPEAVADSVCDPYEPAG